MTDPYTLIARRRLPIPTEPQQHAEDDDTNVVPLRRPPEEPTEAPDDAE